MGLFDIFTSKNADEAAARRRAGYRQGFDQASGYINEGLARAEPYYDQAFNLFALPGERASRGADLYADAWGSTVPKVRQGRAGHSNQVRALRSSSIRRTTWRSAAPRRAARSPAAMSSTRPPGWRPAWRSRTTATGCPVLRPTTRNRN